MVAINVAGKDRCGRGPATKLALLGAVAVTAGAMVAGLTAPVAEADVTFGAVATGPLFRVAQALGVTSIDIPDIDVLGTITINLDYALSVPTVLADDVNAFPFGGFTPVISTFKRQPGGTLGAAILGGSGLGAYQAGIAYEALLASAKGNTPAGYTPLVPSGKVNSVTGEPCTSGLTCVQGVNVTNLALAQVNNPGTPNGGLYARFAPILNLFGVEAVSQGGMSGSSTGVALNAATVGLALGYNLMSDFPATLNPFSLANSLLATALPTNFLGGATLAGTSEDVIYAKLGALAALNLSSTTYGTLAPTDLPLLEPLRLPARLVNAAFQALGVPITVPTPLADALQPAAEILVNVGYTDVQTPSEGGTYNRTYDQSGTYTPYLSVNPLTPAEWAQVPGDVVRALINGFLPGLAGSAGAATSAAAVPAARTIAARTAHAHQPRQPAGQIRNAATPKRSAAARSAASAAG
ncbi:MAG: PE-PPE domain-containing protein [Mycobacteriaceae bacterium]|jgi:hypothetical protein